MPNLLTLNNIIIDITYLIIKYECSVRDSGSLFPAFTTPKAESWEWRPTGNGDPIPCQLGLVTLLQWSLIHV